MTPLQSKVLELKKKIDQLENQMPAHSVPPSMLQALEDLEDELAFLIKELNKGGDTYA